MTHPYASLPDHHFWRKAVTGTERFRVDPVVSTRFQIAPEDRVATAGSCFAQHISRRLSRAGFNYLVTEPGDGLAGPERERRNFGVYPARFGNIYTSRQLLQLFRECMGLDPLRDIAWQRPDGRFVDALRPQVEPDGFDDPGEVRDARLEHLQAVRRMFVECDVFVFTLGLTEAWIDGSDGTALPIAAGVVAGNHDPARYRFHNLDVGEVLADMRAFLGGLRQENPGVRVVLTVSPVALMATASQDRHVMVANAYSKSVLRVCAETLHLEDPGVDYFPSYEIITGSFHRGLYHDDDLRGASALGVDHAMRCFMSHYAGLANAGRSMVDADGADDVICDEEALARSRA